MPRLPRAARPADATGLRGGAAGRAVRTSGRRSGLGVRYAHPGRVERKGGEAVAVGDRAEHSEHGVGGRRGHLRAILLRQLERACP